MIRNKKTMTATAMILMSVILICCKSRTSANKANESASSLVPGNVDVTIAQAHWSGTTLSELSQGYDIFSGKCTQCHETKMPQDFSVDDWNNILPGMGRKAHLDSVQYKLVYRYILTKRETVLAGKK